MFRVSLIKRVRNKLLEWPISQMPIMKIVMIAQESFGTSYELWFHNGGIIIRLKNSRQWMNIFLFRKVKTIYKPTKLERCGVKIFMLFDWEWNWLFAEFHCLHWSNYRMPKSSSQPTLTIWQLQRSLKSCLMIAPWLSE